MYVQHNAVPKVTTIPPACLVKSHEFHNILSSELPEQIKLAEQQLMLEADISSINDSIEELNNEAGLRTNHLHKDLQKHVVKRRNDGSKIKRVKWTYSSLYDGVHAIDELKLKWFKIIGDSIKKDLGTLRLMEEESEDEDRGWDFKRN